MTETVNETEVNETDEDTEVTEPQPTVYVNHLDPNRSLPGGVYLDDVQREAAEIQRAKGEDREPDLENPPAIQSTPVIPVGSLNPEQLAAAVKNGLLDVSVPEDADKPGEVAVEDYPAERPDENPVVPTFGLSTEDGND